MSEDRSIVSQGKNVEQTMWIALLNTTEILKQSNIRYYICNNCDCTIPVEENNRPKVCFKCRRTLDWSDFNPKKNSCPSCNRKYDNTSYRYCGYCNIELV
jgi:hypothetical protein